MSANVRPKPRPKTGEPREVKQPLKIDKLPQEMRDRILQLRAQEGLTWKEIEERSPSFPEWKAALPATCELFPGRRLPHSNLHRWYDLRVEQINQQVMEETARAREIAAAFAARPFKDLPDAVLNALRDQVFTMIQSVNAKDQARFAGALEDLGYLVAQFQKNKIAEMKVQMEEKRVSIAQQELELMKRKIGALKEDVEKKKFTPQELQQKLDELYGLN